MSKTSTSLSKSFGDFEMFDDCHVPQVGPGVRVQWAAFEAKPHDTTNLRRSGGGEEVYKQSSTIQISVISTSNTFFLI